MIFSSRIDDSGIYLFADTNNKLKFTYIIVWEWKKYKYKNNCNELIISYNRDNVSNFLEIWTCPVGLKFQLPNTTINLGIPLQIWRYLQWNKVFYT